MFHGVIQKITLAQFFLRHGVYLQFYYRAEPCISHRRDVSKLSVTRWHYVIMTQARITKSSLTDNQRSFGDIRFIQNSKGMSLNEGVKGEWGSKIGFSANKSPYLRNGARQDQSCYCSLIGSRKINDLGWLRTAITHSVSKMCFPETTKRVWMKIDPYHQLQKCGWMTLISGNIRFMQLYVGVPWKGGVKRQWLNFIRRVCN